MSADLFDRETIERVQIENAARIRAMDSIRGDWRKTINGEGGACPCCDRFGKVYKRSINQTMAKSVVWLAQAPDTGDGWVDVPNAAPRWLVRSNQLATLRWWKLVERKEASSDADQKHSGFWRCTPAGHEWARGNISVPRFAWTYAGEVQKLDGPMIYIADCLGETFSYEATMSGVMGDG